MKPAASFPASSLASGCTGIARHGIIVANAFFENVNKHRAEGRELREGEEVENDEWSLNRRYMQLEGLQTLSDAAPTRLPAVAR